MEVYGVDYFRINIKFDQLSLLKEHIFVKSCLSLSPRRTFNQRALNLKKALRLYNLLMMKRCERLRDLIAEFSSISRSLDKMQKKTKTMGIAGGTTGAVGGVTAVLGIALAPVTMGTSLIATAVGAGMVASAGGMGAHTAKANKKIVGRMAVEKLVYEYKDKIVDLGHCLDFILSEMNELRRHDIPRLQRAGAQTDALKMAHLSQFVIKNNMNNAGKAFAGMSSERLLQAFAKEMDLYFSEKDCEKLKKSRESKFSGRVRLLAENLQDELDQMNRMWEMFSWAKELVDGLCVCVCMCVCVWKSVCLRYMYFSKEQYVRICHFLNSYKYCTA